MYVFSLLGQFALESGQAELADKKETKADMA
jgi:hypothetical protein